MSTTRREILEKNYESIKKQGFQGTRTDRVIEDMGITKGAFYHYFKTKQDLGYAVIDELIAPRYIGMWQQLDHHEDQPIDGIIQILEQFRQQYDDEKIRLGCPLNNLVQEMSPIDDGFQQRLQDIFTEIHAALTRALVRAGNNLQLSALLNEEDAAYFILASLEGCFTLGKAHQSKIVFDKAINQLIRYVRLLKR